MLADGTVVFSEQPPYSGAKNVQGEVWHHAVISRDGGATWEDRVVAKVPVGENCIADGCKPDFYIGQTSVASDAPGHLVFAYEGPTTDLGPQRVTSPLRWTPAGHEHGHAALGLRAERDRPAARGAGDGSALVHADRRRRMIRTRGTSGTAAPRTAADLVGAMKIFDAPAGAAGYVGPSGFAEVYGDYGEIGVTSAGKTFATWGEGFSYTGPGGTWFSVQR